MSLFRPLFRLQRSLPIARAFSQTSSNNAAKITIVGRLGGPPQLVPSENPSSEMIRYVVATSYGLKRAKTSWFRVASFCGNNEKLKASMLSLQKGALVFVEGDAIMHQYEDADGKHQQPQLRIVQRNIEFLEKKRAESEHEEHETEEESSGSEESSDSHRA